jgi:hypothetical protein
MSEYSERQIFEEEGISKLSWVQITAVLAVLITEFTAEGSIANVWVEEREGAALPDIYWCDVRQLINNLPEVYGRKAALGELYAAARKRAEQNLPGFADEVSALRDERNMWPGGWRDY